MLISPSTDVAAGSAAKQYDGTCSTAADSSHASGTSLRSADADTVRIHRALSTGVDEHHDRPGPPAPLHPHIDAMPGEFIGQHVGHQVLTHAADEPSGHESR